MQFTGILWPTFALVALIYGVWFVLYVQRFALMRRTPPTAESFASGEAAKRYFQPAEMPANNFINLFEIPVLFFALVPLLMITHHANHVQVALAWAFVVLRALHSYIQIAVGKIPPRFIVYLASCAVLSAMWIGFAVDIALAG
ncbi:MAPEG family protein [Sphingomonas sp. AOB5]|uniref:MAPEG family protein n=1 Tax=Sphingomonas sp. AOB5 TaxID=3034017 RepID=UPI0023F63AFF|nr:MAPEG family protein [Sphingomonas sp. AOB5]MDF7774562.1 MAPEG family protein [Sphingomonas sp. AOB5]